MISFREAFIMAKVQDQEIDSCIEYENAYIFAGGYDEMMGGWECEPVGVLKDSGRIFSMTELDVIDPGRQIREFMIDDDGSVAGFWFPIVT